ncbi:NB-ARC domain-containing protein [Nodosilinea sp. PGN35]|uniref:NB-ARC domain-containing protein n=1 Tax=Nodosilinea sp. PGN35 TaxID=3020489 RepID=UPI0023B29227|nr:NB-ARC domain-containing protein [Nodosilinea sp. TSF1-S3]MDF0368111.1 NB-ARC domain-containing protein [Nodosilinea sp. TSF1-S3]
MSSRHGARAKVGSGVEKTRSQRRRGVTLTPQGLQKLQQAQRQIELQSNYGQRLTLEELSDRTQLSLKTITKVLDAKVTVDRHTLEAFFAAFDLILDRADYGFPLSTHPPAHPSTHLPIHPPIHTSWGEAIDVAFFCGRTQELALLEKWVVGDRCRLVALLGMGGMGKTALSVKLAQTLLPQFEFVLWRSLRDAPQLSDLLADLLPILSQQQDVKLPPGPTAQIARLMQYLRQHRCLLVLDNGESILHRGTSGHYLPGYEAYADLFQQVGESDHQSCVILTSREKPGEIAALEGDGLPVRSYLLPGLKASDSETLCGAKGLSGTPSDHQQLIDRYRGNPLALKIVATSIRDLFGGSIAEFLQDNTLIFSGMRRLLQQQCDRTSDLEQQIMTWLAIHREWVGLDQLQRDLGTAIPRRQLLEAIEALHRRSLVERGELGFTQQPVVMEFVLEASLEQAFQDLLAWGHADSEGPQERVNPWFHRYPLMRATAKEYLRQSQGRVILTPLAERLRAEVCPQEQLTAHLQRVLERVRSRFAHTPSYSAANLLHLAHHLSLNLSSYDFSQLWVRQAHLVTVPLSGVNFSGATFEHSTFAQPSTYSRAVAFSPDGTLLAAADFNHLRLWDMTGDRLLKTMPHNTWVWRLIFSPDGTRLASGSTDNVVSLWDVASGQCLKVLQGEEEGCSSIAFSPDGRVLAGTYHRQVRLWDTDTWQSIGTLEGHSQRVAYVAIAPVPDSQGRVIVASGSHDQTVRLWDLRSRQCLHILQDHANLVWNLAFSADGQTLATSSMDGTIGLWEVATGRLQRVLKGHTHIVSAATFIPGTDWLVSSSFDQTLKYWDIHQGTCLHTTVAHRGEVWGVSSTADGCQLATVGNDKLVKRWDTQTKQCLSAVGGSSSQIYGVAALGPGLVASGGDDEVTRLWDLATGQCLTTLAGHSSWVWAIAPHPSQPDLATAGGDGTIKLWNRQSGQLRRTLTAHTAAVYGLVYRADGRFLASCGADAGAKLWDAHTGACLRSFAGHRSWVWDCALATHQPWLVTASNDETLKIWDIHTGECLRTLTGHKERIWAVAMAPDDSLVASGSEDYTAKLWNPTTGDCLYTLVGHRSQIKTVAFDPGGRWVATGSQDCTLKLWDTAGQCLRTFEGHRSAVSSLTFVTPASGAPPQLLSGSHDETLRLWDLTTGDCLQVLRPPRLYEGMVLTGAQGLNGWAIAALQELGARV